VSVSSLRWVDGVIIISQADGSVCEPDRCADIGATLLHYISSVCVVVCGLIVCEWEVVCVSGSNV